MLESRWLSAPISLYAAVRTAQIWMNDGVARAKKLPLLHRVEERKNKCAKNIFMESPLPFFPHGIGTTTSNEPESAANKVLPTSRRQGFSQIPLPARCRQHPGVRGK